MLKHAAHDQFTIITAITSFSVHVNERHLRIYDGYLWSKPDYHVTRKIL